jgi:hypothetical protein
MPSRPSEDTPVAKRKTTGHDFGADELDRLRKIQRLIVIGMFSDDDLLDMLVLKGGNAIDIVYGASQRSSLDLDFSIAEDFKAADLPSIEAKMQRALEITFREQGYEILDFSLRARPKSPSSTTADFWGGYQAEFKIVEKAKHLAFRDQLDALRKNAVVVGPRQKRKYTVDISKYEYCALKRREEVDGFHIFVYTPEMIVCEKIRALCQQMPDYSLVVRNSPRSARARDFFDIYEVMKRFGITLTLPENLELLKCIFEAKQVPLHLIGRIADFREFHRADFPALEATVQPDYPLESFDFYFDYVLEQCVKLKSLWIE